MQKYLVRLPQEMRQLMLEAAEVASACNVRIFLVGGFVRDLILSRKNLDLDFLVEGDGIGFAQKLAERLGAVATSHRRFGTATVFLANHLKVDIASSREESYPQPAALPVVRPGTVEDDLRRRDFSINAMAISLNKQDYARMIDFFGGLDDLRRKKIRVLHSLSFTDDPLRILRAIRFEQRFGFKIEPQTLKLLKAAVKAKMLHKVHAHRIRDELILLLKEAEPVKQIERLQSLAGLSFIHPSLTRRKDSRSLFRAIAREISWFKKQFPRRRHLDSWLIYTMALLERLSVAQLKSVMRGFAFHKGEEKRMLSYKVIKKRLVRRLSQPRLKPSQVYSLLEPLSYEAILLLRAAGKDSNLRKNIEVFFSLYNGMRISISGDDLRRLGIPAGPLYEKVLNMVLKAKLDGKLKSREEELALAKKIARVQ